MFPHVVQKIASEWYDSAWVQIVARGHTNNPHDMETFVLGHRVPREDLPVKVRNLVNNKRVQSITRDFWNNDHVQDDDARVWCNVLCYKDLQDKDSVLYRRLAKTQTDRDIEAWAWVTHRYAKSMNMIP